MTKRIIDENQVIITDGLIMSGCGIQSDKKQKLVEALLKLDKSKKPEALALGESNSLSIDATGGRLRFWSFWFGIFY